MRRQEALSGGGGPDSRVSVEERGAGGYRVLCLRTSWRFHSRVKGRRSFQWALSKGEELACLETRSLLCPLVCVLGAILHPQQMDAAVEKVDTHSARELVQLCPYG